MIYSAWSKHFYTFVIVNFIRDIFHTSIYLFLQGGTFYISIEKGNQFIRVNLMESEHAIKAKFIFGLEQNSPLKQLFHPPHP